MRVVALVSGGKDSCYNMMLCRQYGHQIVALANLLPPDDEVQELDSYMYQTVGHNLIGAYAECMGLPLFRKRLGGTSKSIGMTYERTEGDEVEDLRALLAEVKRRVPDVEAVSCGAIRSDYQRIRVEGVCDSLGLASLSFMWRRDQSELMAEMVESGVHAILVKVACLGLVPEKHLGKTIAQMRPVLENLHSRFGVHVCGEGGEYETLTLDCPLFVLGRIVVDEAAVELDETGEAGNYAVREFHVERKLDGGGGDGSGEIGVGEVVMLEVGGAGEEGEEGERQGEDEAGAPAAEAVVSRSERGSYGSVVGRLMAPGGPLSDAELVSSFRNLMEAVKAEVEASEGRPPLSKSVVVYFSIRDMTKFALLNRVYKAAFGTVNPPSRCCVEMDLSENEWLRIQVLTPAKADLERSREIMHVQSISRWAPSCVGPYSQAARFGDCVYVSGQLGLDPPTMAFVEGETLARELEKTIQHCESVCEAVGSVFSSDLVKLVVFVERGAAGLGLGGLAEGCGAEGLPRVYVEVPKLPKGARVELHPFLYSPKGTEGAEITVVAAAAVAEGVGVKGKCAGVEWTACAYAAEIGDGTQWEEVEAAVYGALARFGLEREDVVVFNLYFVGGLPLLGEGSCFGTLPVQSFPVSGCGLGEDMGAKAVVEVLAHRV